MSNSPNPVVGIVMGSQSDWPTMQVAAETLDALGVPYEARVLSAHRVPDETGRTAFAGASTVGLRRVR